MDSAERKRIEMTCRCRDADPLPRVPEAGRVEMYRGERVQVLHNGLRVIAGGYQGAWLMEVIERLKGCHEPREELALWKLLPRLPQDAIMVELGAWWAYYTAWFLRERPKGRAVCVEPDPAYIAVGQKNLALNDLEAVWRQAAVDAHSGPTAPFVCESNGQTYQLERVSVDGLNLPRIDLLLADIQGAELAMLTGCEQTIKASRPRFLVLSTHHHAISGDPLMHQRCLERIQSLGGHVLAEHTIPESFSGDGLIAASFAPADRDMPPIPITRNRASENMWQEPEYDLADALFKQAQYESFRGAFRQALKTGRGAAIRRLKRLGSVLGKGTRARSV